MDSQRRIGLVLFIGGLSAYVAGVHVAYPGRAFSITAVMLGLALAATAGSASSEESV